MDGSVDGEERCELYDLITTQCAHCRHQNLRPQFLTTQDTTDRDRDWDEGEGDMPWLPSIVAHFPARWPGRCARCDNTFEAGAWVSKTVDGDYLCSCAS